MATDKMVQLGQRAVGHFRCFGCAQPQNTMRSAGPSLAGHCLCLSAWGASGCVWLSGRFAAFLLVACLLNPASLAGGPRQQVGREVPDGEQDDHFAPKGCCSSEK